MTTAELIRGWTQFILNVVLIGSSLKIVHDISTYIKHSDRRFKAIYFKVCRAGERLTVFSSKLKQRKFRHPVVQLLELDSEVENPFVDTPYEQAAEEFKNVKERYNTYHWKLWHQ